MVNPSIFETFFNDIVSDGALQERKSKALEFAGLLKSDDLSSNLASLEIMKKLESAAENKKSTSHRQGSMLIYESLAFQLGHHIEPFLISQLPIILNAFGDKQSCVKEAAESAADALLSLPGQFAITCLVKLLLGQLSNEKKWHTKVAALTFLGKLTKKSALQISNCLPEIIPGVSDAMWDTKPEVREAATKCMGDVTSTIDNIDIVPFLPVLISCIARPEEVPECVYKLAATTFVTEVKAPTLAIMVPLLVRGLAERKPAVLRQTSVIIDNMCKLVENPADAHQFLPKLLPGLDRII